MSRLLWGVVLLAGCAPPVEETVAGIAVVVIAFLIPLLAAAVFSVLTAWGLIAAGQARRLASRRSGAIQATVACLVCGCLYAAAALGNAWIIQLALAGPEPEALQWFTWPGPTTPGGTVLLGLSAAIMLATGGLCAIATAPEESL